MNNFCLSCEKEIKIQIFKGTDHCSELCRKKLENEWSLLKSEKSDI